MNLGLAFYSRTFTLKDPSCNTPGCPFSGGGTQGACTKNSGTLSYREITEVLSSTGVTPTYDQTDGVKYFSWNSNQWASYDDEETFQQKIHYANGMDARLMNTPLSHADTIHKTWGSAVC